MIRGKTNHQMIPRMLMAVLYVMPLMVLVVLWQLYSNCNPRSQFIFSSPSLVGDTLVRLIKSGQVFEDTGITAFEALSGFILGTTCGALIGLTLWYSRLAARIARPYIAALGCIPVFALSPMIIAWFGIGVLSKIMLAFISTVTVSIIQSYQGATSAEERFLQFMQVVGASRRQTFRIIIIPSALTWVLNGMKLSISLALLGAFIGEFISAEHGLGYMIVRASGLYDMATVIAGVLILAAMALAMAAGVEIAERRLMPWRTAK